MRGTQEATPDVTIIGADIVGICAALPLREIEPAVSSDFEGASIIKDQARATPSAQALQSICCQSSLVCSKSVVDSIACPTWS